MVIFICTIYADFKRQIGRVQDIKLSMEAGNELC